MPNLIKIINDELRGLADAGCPHIQLDVPAFSVHLTVGTMTAEEAADIIIQCFDGVDAPRRGIHICSGNLRGRPLAGNLTSLPWINILERLDGVINVANVAVHYFNRWLERQAWARVPQSIEIAAGIVDEGCYYVEPVAKIRDRAADWAQVLGEERLWIGPSCGFGRHTSREIPVLRQKLENLKEAAACF
jgi:5-methyltetrahydropteroyltriglutamate--homocysteine methyltransferase